MRLSVVIPVYNEIETIAEIIRRVRTVALLVPVRYGPDADTTVELEREIVLVEDGSTDGTRELLYRMRDEPGLRVVFHEQNRGKGAAVRTGLEYASGDIVVIQDADLEYDPSDYLTLLQPIVEGRAQVVYGSRFSGRRTEAMSLGHNLGNRFLTLMANLLYHTSLSDMETCYKTFTREVAQRLQLKETGWGFDPEITAQILRLGYPILEVPITYAGRAHEEGKKIRWYDGWTVLWTLLRYRFGIVA